MPKPEDDRRSSRPEWEWAVIENTKQLALLIAKFEAHIDAEEKELAHYIAALNGVKSEIKEQQRSLEKIAADNLIHIDNKVDSCNSKLISTLKNDYLTRSEIITLRDESLMAATKERREEIDKMEDDILSRIKTYIGVAGGAIVAVAAGVEYIMTHWKN